MPPFSHLSTALALSCGLALTGCAVGPLWQAPQAGIAVDRWQVHAAAAMVAADGAVVTLTEDAVPPQWWTLFNDTMLVRLQAEASEGSLDLQTALIRIEESQARLGVTVASEHPHINWDGGYARSAISADSPLAKLGVPTKSYNQWQWGWQASWELDLWGHQKQQTESARAQLEATHWAASAARITLSAEVARSYLMLRGVQAQQRLVADHRRIAAELLRLTESRERNGVATRFDSSAARAELATVEARALQLEHQRDVLMSALALLLGQPPRQLDERLTPSAALLAPPSQLPVGVPSDLVRQRPDILQAEALLRAATADKGAAKADFYPRVSLNAGWSFATSHFNDLTNWDMRQFSVGPVVHLPVFDGGRLKQTLALTDARQRSSAIAWRQTVLRAWHEVGAALDGCASEQARRVQLEQAAAFQAEALKSAKNAWKAGSAEFTTVLVAQRSLLNAQSALADGTTASSLAVVSLYRALGGGGAKGLAPERLAMAPLSKSGNHEVTP